MNILNLLCWIAIQSVVPQSGPIPKKMVAYKEYRYTNYYLPSGMEPNQASPADIVEAIPYTTHVDVVHTIDQNNNMVTEKQYRAGASGVSEYAGVSKVILSPNNTRFFNAAGVEYQADQTYFPPPSDAPALTEDQVNRLAYYETINPLNSTQKSQLTEQGFEVVTNPDGIAYIMKEDVNIVSNPTSNHIEYRMFKNGYFHRSHSRYYFDIGNHQSILYKTVDKRIKTLASGVNLLIEEVVLYSDYKIIKNGIVEYQQPSNSISELQIRNRANTLAQYEPIQVLNRKLPVRQQSGHFYTLSLPSLREGKGEMYLFDLTGKLVFKQNIASENEYTVDLSNLAPGTYILHYVDDLGRISVTLIHY